MKRSFLSLTVLLNLVSLTRANRQAAPRDACLRLSANATVLDSIDADLARNAPDRSTQGGRSVSCTLARLDRDSVAVLALAGSDERTGGIAIVAPRSDSILYVYPYPAARELKAAGNRRVLFTYTEARELFGAGIYESDYVLLCGVSRRIWLPCLQLPRDHIENVLDSPTPVRFEEHNIAILVGDSLRYTRRSVLWIEGMRDSTAQRLGTVTLALPRLP